MAANVAAKVAQDQDLNMLHGGVIKAPVVNDKNVIKTNADTLIQRGLNLMSYQYSQFILPNVITKYYLGYCNWLVKLVLYYCADIVLPATTEPHLRYYHARR